MENRPGTREQLSVSGCFQSELLDLFDALFDRFRGRVENFGQEWILMS